MISTKRHTQNTILELQILENLCKKAEKLDVGDVIFYELLQKMNSLNVARQLNDLATTEQISALRDRFDALKKKAIVHLDRCIAQLTSIDLSSKQPPI